jgi:hypothetical protein
LRKREMARRSKRKKSKPAARKSKKTRSRKKPPVRPRREEPIFDVGGGMGPADAMVKLVQPLLDLTDGSPEQMNKALTLGMTAWNLDLLPPEEREKAMQNVIEAKGWSGETAEDFRELVNFLIQRKRALGIR